MEWLKGVFEARQNLIRTMSSSGGHHMHEPFILPSVQDTAAEEYEPVHPTVVINTTNNQDYSSSKLRQANRLAVESVLQRQGSCSSISSNNNNNNDHRALYIPPSPTASKQALPQVHSWRTSEPSSVGGAGAAKSSTNGAAASWKAAAFGITNLASVVAIVFANKLVLYTHGFGFAVTLTWLHTLFTALGMMVMAAAGVFEVKRVPLIKSVPVAAVYVGFIVLNNLSIKLNTVGFYHISKIAITPVIVGIELLCFSKVPSGRVLASIAVLLTGITLATITDSQVASRPLGMLVAAINVLVTGLYQVWAGSKQRELGLNGLQLLHQVSPSAVVLLMVLIPFLEPVGLLNAGPGTVLGFHMTPAAAFWIAVSSGLGLVVTLSTFLFIGATSSLTYNVVGHLKTVLIVSGGVFIFGDSMVAKKFVGLCIAMAGIVWYSSVKMQEAAGDKESKK